LEIVRLRSSKPFFSSAYNRFVFRRNSVFFTALSAYLLPFTALYLIFIYLKKIFTRGRDYGFPVISVGNIVSGGTGKTPLVMEIVRELHGREKMVAVASSGFRDETIMLGKNFPRLEFTRKSRQGLAALKGFPGTVVLDDGFHCRWVKKDLNIVVIDASNPFDNGLPLPSGFLREPKHFIEQADLFVVTRTYMVSRMELKALHLDLRQFGRPVYVMEYEIESLRGKHRDITTDIIPGSHVIAFAGIGSPINFFALLATLNPSKISGVIYPDHFYYREKDVDELCRLSLKERTDCVITTEKDFVKLENKWPRELPLFYLAFKSVLKNMDGTEIGFDTLLAPMLK